MKQKLKNLKELTNKFIESRDNFEKRREEFELYSLILTEEDVEYLDLQEVLDSYDLANVFYDKFGFVVDYANALKEKHPRYGEKRFKNTLIETIILEQGWDYEEDYDKAKYVVDTHLSLEGLGYFKVKALENEMISVADEISVTTGLVVEQSVNAIKGAGMAVADVFRPYGQVAKGQLKVAEKKAKDVVNKGAKKLIKVLSDVADKTESNK